MAQLTMQVSLLPSLPINVVWSVRAENGSPPSPLVPSLGQAPLPSGASFGYRAGSGRALIVQSRDSMDSPTALDRDVAASERPEPSFCRGSPPLAVRLMRHIFFPSGSGSSQRRTPVSLKATFPDARSQTTRSEPRPSCTWPHTASRGLTRHNAQRRASQPAAWRSWLSSQCVLGGVCVTTTSASSGMSFHTLGKSSDPVGARSWSGEEYVNAEKVPCDACRGDRGEPKTLNVVRGPSERDRRTRAEVCSR